jgi:myosin heavy subunit
MLDQKVSGNSGDRNKIYFLIIVIVALLGTNAYLYFRDKHENQRFVSANTEKDRLKLEVEKIEVELDKVNVINTTLSEKLLEEQKHAREKIAELKFALQQGQFTQGELNSAQKEVKKLRQFVKNFTDEIAHLHEENDLLKTERDSLINSVNVISKKARKLEKKNSELNSKVKTGSSLKAFNMEVLAYRVKNNGKQVKVSNAKSAKKLVVNFNIAPNPLAEKNYHKVYLRVFDPAGNLIADENNMFDANNQPMQYSEMITLAFKDDGETYSMAWVNPKEFIKGTYAVILYVDGATMGQSSIVLK